MKTDLYTYFNFSYGEPERHIEKTHIDIKDLIYYDVMSSMYYYNEQELHILDFKRTLILGYEGNICMAGRPNTEGHWSKLGMKLFKISREMKR